MTNERLYTKNYYLIDLDGTLDLIQSLDYSCLMECANGQLPSCFFKKLTRIDWLDVKGLVQDEDHLFWFLKLSSVKNLILSGPQLSKAFYGQLPALLRPFCSLHSCTNDKRQLQMNFEFISEMPCLIGLEILLDLLFEFLTSLVGSVSKIEVWNRKKLFQSANLDAIVNFFEQLKSEPSN